MSIYRQLLGPDNRTLTERDPVKLPQHG